MPDEVTPRGTFAADEKRQALYAQLVEIGFYPGELPRRALYSHADKPTAPFAMLPNDGKLPLRSREKFVYLASRTALKPNPTA